MINKRLLILLTVIAIYVFFAIPYAEREQTEVNAIRLLKAKISRETNILENKSKIIEKLSQSKTEYDKYIKYFYPANISISKAMDNYQQMFSSFANESGLEIVSAKWGEAVENENYVALPIIFIMNGYPRQVDNFFGLLSKSDKLYSIKTLRVGRRGNYNLTINFISYAYKLVKKAEK